MATIFFYYCINIPLKWFVCLQNKFFNHFILSPHNSILKRTNIRWEIAFVLFSTPPISRELRSGLKSCLIAILSVFFWSFNSLAWFLTDVVRSFLITTASTDKKKTFFLFSFSLKRTFWVNFFFALYTVNKET